MPQPQPRDVTSTPAQPGQPYDACNDAALGPWRKLDGNAGHANINTGRIEQPYDDDGHGWKQT